MTTPIRVVSLTKPKDVVLDDSLVHRGDLPPLSHLQIKGDIKLGRFSNLQSHTKVSCHSEDQNFPDAGGTIVVAERFEYPAAISLRAERRIFASSSMFKKAGIFDHVNIIAPFIDLSNVQIPGGINLRLAADDVSINIPTLRPIIYEGSELRAGELNTKVSIGPFDQIRAKTIVDFSHRDGSQVTAHEVRADLTKDSSYRCNYAYFKQAGGTLCFFPADSLLADSPSFDDMFDSNNVNYSLLIKDLLIQESKLVSQVLARQALLFGSPSGSVANDYGALGDLDCGFENLADDNLIDFIVNNSKISPRDLYRESINLIMSGGEEQKRGLIIIKDLQAWESDSTMRGNNSTKVYVHNGDLKIKNLASRGVKINCPRGVVFIIDSLSCEADENKDLPPSQIEAREIRISQKVFENTDFDKLELKGEVIKIS